MRNIIYRVRRLRAGARPTYETWSGGRRKWMAGETGTRYGNEHDAKAAAARARLREKNDAVRITITVVPYAAPSFQVEGNKGASYVRMEETEAEGIIRLEVGHDCVVWYDKEIAVVELTEILSVALAGREKARVR